MYVIWTTGPGLIQTGVVTVVAFLRMNLEKVTSYYSKQFL